MRGNTPCVWREPEETQELSDNNIHLTLWRREGRKEGWAGKVLHCSTVLRNFHWKVLEPKSPFRGVLYLPKVGLL